MRVIDNTALANMRSPVRRLFEILHRPLINIAPEASERFERSYGDFTLRYVDSPGWILSVKEGVISISTLVLEVMWVTGYSHFVVYRDVFVNPEMLTASTLNLRGTERLARAMDLLGWIVSKERDRGPAEWPVGLPSPVGGEPANPGEPSDEGVADEFCLGGCACLLHHELAHILLRHNEASRVEIEQEADNASWEWMLPAGTDVTALAAQKRLMLIVHAYLWLVIRDIHRGSFASLRHPRGIDRLTHVLARMDAFGDHVGYSFAYAVLHVHLCLARQGPGPAPQAPCVTFRDAYERTIEHLSRVR